LTQAWLSNQKVIVNYFRVLPVTQLWKWFFNCQYWCWNKCFIKI